MNKPNQFTDDELSLDDLDFNMAGIPQDQLQDYYADIINSQGNPEVLKQMRENLTNGNSYEETKKGGRGGR